MAKIAPHVLLDLKKLTFLLATLFLTLSLWWKSTMSATVKAFEIFIIFRGFIKLIKRVVFGIRTIYLKCLEVNSLDEDKYQTIVSQTQKSHLNDSYFVENKFVLTVKWK